MLKSGIHPRCVWRPDITLSIRSIAADDIPLIEECMPRRMPDTHRERLGRQEQGEALYLIAWIDDRPVGHLFLKWDGSSASPDAFVPWPTLSDISVHPDLRSRGIGSQLMKHAERLVAQRGHRQVGLSVALDNPRARALYERMGYRNSGLDNYDSLWPYLDDQDQERWHRETCVRLVKRLQQSLP
jgi:ribosomal protein S18 acetylase RimI-like enzyme